MAEKLKIIPLGGLNEIGKNMTAYEYGGEIIVVDCGMAFPGDDMYGIDLIIPDVSYLIKNRARIRGLFITHGHEDHVGAIPYVLNKFEHAHLLHPPDRRTHQAEAGGAWARGEGASSSRWSRARASGPASSLWSSSM